MSKKMNISRHNYEEFFILYADNELSRDERQEVENFVLQHPDLREELEALLQAKLIPDTSIVFENKESLMKPAGAAPIQLSDYEEWLLLYLDDELTAEQKKGVEKFMAAHEAVRQEFLLLQKARLQPETIAFPFKETLYRETEKVPVVQMPLRRKRVYRMAAAAILLFAMALTALLVLHNKKLPGDDIVVIPVPKEQNVKEGKNESLKNNPEHAPTSLKPEQKENNQREDINNPVQNNHRSVAATAQKNPPLKNNSVNRNTNEQKEEPVLVISNGKPQHNNLPQPLDNPYVTNEVAKTDTPTPNNKTTDASQPVNKTDVTNALHQPSLTSEPALVSKSGNPEIIFTGYDEENQSNNRSRGFFRKAVRFFEKTTKINPANDDDRVLIGGLAVKLK
jgi:hypothetical protein